MTDTPTFRADIDLVRKQFKDVSFSEALRALRATDGDLVSAIIKIANEKQTQNINGSWRKQRSPT